jgi:signal transduction histidine kinase
MTTSPATNILLVDDNARNLDALEAILAAPHLTLHRATDASEALLSLVRHDFAAIVLDVQMPGIGGVELAQMIKARRTTRHIPILLLTAHFHEDRDVLRGYGAGAVDFLTKPVNPDILRSKVEVFVDLYRKTQALAERTAELARANESLKAEMAQREHAERARAELLGQLVFAQEDERRRIGREMHDRFGEHLTALSLRLVALKERCAPYPEIAEQIVTLEGIAASLDHDVDALVWELRPTALDDLGLLAALSHHVRSWSEHTGITAQLHTSGLTESRMDSAAETTLYRIAQEALTNVARHAQASHVDILLERRADHVSLIVEDNGVGFTPPGRLSSGTAGLGGMQERAALIGATLQIESSPGCGTTILVRAPLTNPILQPVVSDEHV